MGCTLVFFMLLMLDSSNGDCLLLVETTILPFAFMSIERYMYLLS